MSSAIPTGLPPRFEIRPLTTLQHLEWATAIVNHSNIFCGRIFPVLYPDNKAKRFFDDFAACSNLVRHGIASGTSFGVFDLEYQFKHPDAAAVGGKLIRGSSPEEEASLTEDQILERMDFPLASVAMAYDGYYRLDKDKLASLAEALPVMKDLFARSEQIPTRLTPEIPGQLVRRNATSTRRDYEGKGLMKALSYYQMRAAARMGYAAIQMDAMNSAVKHVWSNPPAPFSSELVDEYVIGSVEVEAEGGERIKPYAAVQQIMSRNHVTLVPSA